MIVMMMTYLSCSKALHKYVEHKRTAFHNVDEEHLKQLLLTTPETKKRSSAELEDNTQQKGTCLLWLVAKCFHTL